MLKGGGVLVSILSCPFGPPIRLLAPCLVGPTLLPVIVHTVPPHARAASGAQLSMSFLYTCPLLLAPVKLMSSYWLGVGLICSVHGSPTIPPAPLFHHVGFTTCPFWIT